MLLLSAFTATSLSSEKQPHVLNWNDGLGPACRNILAYRNLQKLTECFHSRLCAIYHHMRARLQKLLLTGQCRLIIFVWNCKSGSVLLFYLFSKNAEQHLYLDFFYTSRASLPWFLTAAQFSAEEAACCRSVADDATMLSIQQHGWDKLSSLLCLFLRICP